jgi:hypothetical protein
MPAGRVREIPWLSSLLGLVAAVGMLAGCGSKPIASEPGGEQKSLCHEGKGLKLPEETRQSLGLQTAPAGPQSVHCQFSATAQVFEMRTNAAAAGRVLASAFLPASAARPKAGTRVEFRTTGSTNVTASGTVVRVDETTRSAFGQVEVAMEAPEAAGRLAVGSSVAAHLEAGAVQAATAIPRGALVRAALGDFVYVADGQFLKRVPVKVGVEDDAWAEILDGLPPGKVVVTHGALSLWLLELSEVGGMANIK